MTPSCVLPFRLPPDGPQTATTNTFMLFDFRETHPADRIHTSAETSHTFADMGVGREKAAAMVARSLTVKSAKLAMGTLAAPPTAPKSLVRAWSLTMDPGMLIAVVPKNLGQVSERLISSAMVEIVFAARSDEGGGRRAREREGGD